MQSGGHQADDGDYRDMHCVEATQYNTKHGFPERSLLNSLAHGEEGEDGQVEREASDKLEAGLVRQVTPGLRVRYHRTQESSKKCGLR